MDPEKVAQIAGHIRQWTAEQGPGQSMHPEPSEGDRARSQVDMGHGKLSIGNVEDEDCVAGIPMDDADDAMGELDVVDMRVLASATLGVDITEVFSPVRVDQVAGKFGFSPGSSLDMTNGWNFDLEADRRRAWKLVKQTQPRVLIGSPPFTRFSTLQELNTYVHRNDPSWIVRFDEQLRTARGHIEMCKLLYRHQLRQGRHFIHEHLWGTKPWRMESVQDIARSQGRARRKSHVPIWHDFTCCRTRWRARFCYGTCRVYDVCSMCCR